MVGSLAEVNRKDYNMIEVIRVDEKLYSALAAGEKIECRYVPPVGTEPETTGKLLAFTLDERVNRKNKAVESFTVNLVLSESQLDQLLRELELRIKNLRQFTPWADDGIYKLLIQECLAIKNQISECVEG